MSVGELACSLSVLILHDEKIPVTAEKILALVKSANIDVESYWPSLFAKLAQNRNIEDLILNAGGGGGAPVAVATAAGGGGGGSGGGPASEAPPPEEKKKEEPQEESDDDMGFSLFD